MEEARKHLDILVIFVVALGAYHVALHLTGHPQGIMSDKRWF